jgi:hypothetical protein
LAVNYEIANSAESLQRIIGKLRAEWTAHKFLRVAIKTGKDRSLDANAVTHVWYGQIARELGDTTAAAVHAECKLMHGVPILRAEDADFRAMYDRLFKGRFTYAEKLEIMERCDFPVTRLMTTDQMNRYRDAVQHAYAEGNPRIILEYKDEKVAA